MITVLLFQNARLIDPTQDLDQREDILIQEGRIAAVSRGISPPEGSTVIDLSDRWVVPGLIDMHVHLREPGEEYKETIVTGTAAAVCGGFTAVACMPNTRPVNDSAAVTHFILDRAKKIGKAKVYPVAALTIGQAGDELAEFGDLKAAGAVGLSDDGHPVTYADVMRRALEYARNFDLPVISHAEELSLSKGGLVNEGRISTLLGLQGIPAAAEEVAVFRDVTLAALTGSRLHIAHVSTAGSLDIIRRAKAAGVTVTAETAPHYFSMTEEAVLGYNTLAKMNPPLRTEEDRRAMIQGLKDGTLDAIATDHAPHSTLEKACQFQLAANGIIGLETALPLTLRLVQEGHLTPQELVDRLSSGPARILRLPGGSLREGAPADLCVIDPEATFTFTEKGLHSLSHNSPFLGQRMQGRAVLTLVNGRPVYDPEHLLATSP